MGVFAIVPQLKCINRWRNTFPHLSTKQRLMCTRYLFKQSTPANYWESNVNFGWVLMWIRAGDEQEKGTKYRHILSLGVLRIRHATTAMYIGHLENHLKHYAIIHILIEKRNRPIVVMMTLSRGDINSSVIAIASLKKQQHRLFIHIGHWSVWCDFFRFTSVKLLVFFSFFFLSSSLTTLRPWCFHPRS